MRVFQKIFILFIFVVGVLQFPLIMRYLWMDTYRFTDHVQVPTMTLSIVPPSHKKIVSFLPKVIQPVTYFECCRFPQLSTKTERKLDPCFDTCYSKEVCEDKLYPYSSDDEKTFFKWNRSKNPQLRMEKKKCARSMSNNPPQPATWCQQPQHNQQRQRQPQRMNLTNIPTGCSWVMGMGTMSGPFDRMILIPAGKLAFCGIPKVGCSSWIQFLRFTIGAKDYLSLPHAKADVNFFRFDRLPPKNQNHVLQSDEWTKAVFLRDPAERFLSAYLDKIQNMDKYRHIPPNMTFAEFVDFVDQPNATCEEDRKNRNRRGLTWCTDPHWRPQAFSCGLWELLPHFDFVGNINNADLATRSLLEKVDIWDSYGKHYRAIKKEYEGKRGREGSSRCKTLPPKLLGSKDEFEGFQQKGIRNSTKNTYEVRHKKNSVDKMKLYYTEELLEKVKRIYADDYRLWNALSKSDVGWFSGKKMAALLNPTCAVD